MKYFTRLCLLLTLTLLFAIDVSAQFAQSLATASHGDISEIKDKRRVYVDVHTLFAEPYTPVRQSAINELRKYNGVDIVNSPDQADFLLLLLVGPATISPTRDIRLSDIQVMAVTGKPESPSRILWQYSFPSTNNQLDAITATRTFIKALKKARGEK